jgi:hypothetical protein
MNQGEATPDEARMTKVQREALQTVGKVHHGQATVVYAGGTSWK